MTKMPPSGVLVTVILVRGLAWAPLPGLLCWYCGAAVQRLTAVAHPDASRLSLFVCSRGTWNSPGFTCICSWTGGQRLCAAVTSAKSSDLSVTQLPLLWHWCLPVLSIRPFCPQSCLTIVTASKVLPPSCSLGYFLWTDMGVSWLGLSILLMLKPSSPTFQKMYSEFFLYQCSLQVEEASWFKS